MDPLRDTTWRKRSLCNACCAWIARTFLIAAGRSRQGHWSPNPRASPPRSARVDGELILHPPKQPTVVGAPLAYRRLVHEGEDAASISGSAAKSCSNKQTEQRSPQEAGSLLLTGGVDRRRDEAAGKRPDARAGRG